MKSHSSTLFILLAPCAVLAGFAFYLSRAPRPKPNTNLGPFQLRVVGVTKQRALPFDSVYKGYDRHFQLVFAAQGKLPKWWGRYVGEAQTSGPLKNWTFWLDKGHKRLPFHPTKGQLWTSRFDKNTNRYMNEFLLKCGNVPQDCALKVRGTAPIADHNIVLTDPVPFEVTLKKAGEKWATSQG